MNPFLTATLVRFEELYDDLVALLNGVNAASFDWKPPAAEMNSTAILVKHMTVSIESWLGRALDEPMDRDRDAEFRFSGSRDELIAIVQESREQVRELLGRLDGIDPDAARHYVRVTKPEQKEFTVAWCVEHALVHTAEHWGEIQLIQQLFTAQGHSNSERAFRSH